jgi:hypothetical protein
MLLFVADRLLLQVWFEIAGKPNFLANGKNPPTTMKIEAYLRIDVQRNENDAPPTNATNVVLYTKSTPKHYLPPTIHNTPSKPFRQL